MNASIQKRQCKIEQMFTEAEAQWALKTLCLDIKLKTGNVLSPKPMQYLKGLLCGYDIAEIAEKLNVTEGTVKEALSNKVSPAIKDLMGIKAIKSFMDIPTLLAPYRRVIINIPDIFSFYGRKDELATLTRWRHEDDCRLVILQGRGGVGKTYLIAKWLEIMGDEFPFAIRLEMGASRSFDQLIWDIVKHLPGYQKADIPSGIDNQIEWLLSALNRFPCVIIFDDIHHLFALDQFHLQERYNQPKRDVYEALFRRLGTDPHQSCIVAIGWQRPREFERIEQPRSPIKYLHLEGLKFEDAQHILRDYGLIEDIACWKEIVQNYRGLPYSLKLVSKYISGLVYEKDVQKFLIDNTVYLGKSETLIFEQFKQLHPSCQFLLLIISQQGIVSISALQEILGEYTLSWSTSTIGEALEELHEMGLIESNDRKISSPPDIIKCVLKDCQSLLPKLLEKLAT